ncbi:MAG TPA: agmatine deiminase family protein [Solirubrobacteraceae bacterium]|nr:agmatine deiminase family protein [Solirubrobacteraceae bacterium]
MSAALRMPAEWAPHERTIVCWPARVSMWQERFADAKAEHAAVVNAIAAFEPVTLAVDPSQEAEARAAVRGDVDVVAIPLDDSWSRDNGPIFVTADGRRAGVDFGFNAWGEMFTPYDQDAEFAARVLEHLGEERVAARDLIFEGGSIAVDGEGTLITTEQCLLHPNRNPALSREQIEARLRETLGVERIVWLGLGLVEDADTDGHVDNICAWIEPGRVLLQTVADEADPNYEHCRENARRLGAAGIDVVELDVLPRLDVDGPPTVVPYVNYYVANGALIVPVTGAEADADALALLERLYPGHEAVAVSGTTLALGGGGVHCITQQVPAV